ncbi:MAG: Ig-like domain-containing protein, partial [Monoglobaceae bacterium]
MSICIDFNNDTILSSDIENPETKTEIIKIISVGDITLNYKKSATITPIIDADEGAEYTVTYTSSNPSVARVDENGKVYGAKKGSADIT